MLPDLITARLDLRPAGNDDLDVLWALWAEPDVRRFLFDDVPVTRERAAEVLGHCLQAAEAGLGLWVARRRDAETVIGCVGLMAASTAAQYDPRLLCAIEPLAAFSPSVWGHGYATEALAAVVRYAFEQLGWSQLGAVNDVPNAASDRLVRRLGFEVTGECDGPRYRLRTYVLTRERFANRRLDSSGVYAAPAQPGAPPGAATAPRPSNAPLYSARGL
jgi:[ribosomal protein S5]-alanine N-acetyltransferase